MLKISIIVPIYNVEDYIERCIDSIIDQECDDYKLECVFVNDCTPDKAMEIIDRKLNNYLGTIDFLIVNHEVNRGLSATRNSGIKNASGDFVLFVDSDDRLAHGALGRYVEMLKRQPKDSDIDIIMGNVWLCKEGKPVMDSLDYNYLLIDNSREDALRMLLKKKLFHTAWNKLVRRSVLLKYGVFFENGIIMEDLLWSYLFFLYSRKVLVLKEITYYYENNPYSIMNTMGKDASCILKSHIFILNKILETPPKISYVEYYMYLFYILIRAVDVYEIHKKEDDIVFYNESLDEIRKRFLNHVLNKHLYFSYVFFLSSKKPYSRVLFFSWYRKYFNKMASFVMFISRLTTKITGK